MLTCDFCHSSDVLAKAGVEAEGDDFEAALAGKEVHRFQVKREAGLARSGLRKAGWESGLMRELLSPRSGLCKAGWESGRMRELRSPSDAAIFFLKLRARRKPPINEPPFETEGD